MNIHQKQGGRRLVWAVLVCMALFMAGCADAATPGGTAVSNPAPSIAEQAHEAPAELLPLPDLEAAPLAGKPLQVVATTSIIGDVVAQVGGEAIDLTTLMSAGQDPHSYQSGARELTAVADAHVIFVNGWDLEDALVKNLKEIGGGVPLISISANIIPLALGADEHGHADPHVWFSIDNVVQWSDNVAHVLSALDPANAPTYAANAAAYQAELAELAAATETQLAQIPAEKRFLITNHDSLRYFADRYGFTLLGAVIPGSSTLAEPSASDLTGLLETMHSHHLCTLFTETTVSDTLAQTVASELSGCDEVKVLPLYTGAIGPAGSGADSYIGMFRANVDTIVSGLAP